MATRHQAAYYQNLAVQAEALNVSLRAADRAAASVHAAQTAGMALDAVIAAGRAQRQAQIEAGRQQAQRIAGLTWGDVACAIRALGMPEASEDFVRVCRSLSHVVGERGYDNAEELLQSLDIAAECAQELRMPLPVSEREQADADACDIAERRFEEARDGL